MRLSIEQVTAYRRDGFVDLGPVFAGAELAAITAAFRADREVPGPHRITEDDGRTVRAVYASHLRHPVFRLLVRDARLLAPATAVAGPDLYVYQFKINTKRPFGGAAWSWHQDYVVWRAVDDLPRPDAVNVAVFLDDVTEFNGPVIFVPGSHRLGPIERPRAARAERHVDPGDYALRAADLAALPQARRMVSPKGPAGSVVLFHPEIVHGSAVNISPFPRDLLIVTYNAVGNQPRHRGEPRAEFLVGRDTAPLEMTDGVLA